MDGTLTDLRKRWWDPFFRAFELVKPNYDKKKGELVFENSIGGIIKQSGGKSRFFIVKIVWKVTRAMNLNPIETFKLIRYLRKDEMAFKEIVPFESSEKVVKQLFDKKYQLALITTASRSTVNLALRQYDFFSCFDPIITRDDVKETKPNPEPLILAGNKLKVDLAETVMIGDFPLDVQAGKAAGSKTIAILGDNAKYTQRLIEKEDPDLILQNLEDLLEVFK